MYHWARAHFGTDPAYLGDVGLNATKTEFGTDFGQDELLNAFEEEIQVDPYAIGGSLGAMQDMDSEVEALEFAVSNDPYALGQAL